EHDFSTIGRRIMLLNARQIKRVSGKERIILLAIEDITVRREIEKGMEKARAKLEELSIELKRTSRVKSEFLANMSHELRTPLNSIIGFSEVLYDETFGKLNEKQKEYVNYVLVSGKHLLLLINDVLDMAKVEAGKMELSLSSLSLKNTLEDALILVKGTALKKGITLALQIDENIDKIEADERKLKEILYNLFSNAIKFTLQGGSVKITAQIMGTEIEVAVSDTGIGIAPENISRVFEAFTRIENSYSKAIEGTGLGLGLSKKLIELHGGEIWIESAGLNTGTTVKFTLPIKAKKG
ncbi:MAG: ATP-binding protein, partial [Planctomycetota bacterium]